MTVYAFPGTDGAKVEFKPRYEHYIGGEWVAPVSGEYFENITPVTGQVFTEIARGTAEDIEAALRGTENLARHVENLRKFGLEPVIALNRFPTDTEAELDAVLGWAKEQGFRAALSEVWAKGGEGGLAVADEVLAAIDRLRGPEGTLAQLRTTVV